MYCNCIAFKFIKQQFFSSGFQKCNFVYKKCRFRCTGKKSAVTECYSKCLWEYFTISISCVFDDMIMFNPLTPTVAIWVQL